MRVVDTHLHLWDPALLSYPWLDGALARRFGPAELRAAGGAGRDASYVFVQAECEPAQSWAEVEWVRSLADELPIAGIVARAPLEDGSAAVPFLDRLAAEPLVVGVRRPLQDEPGALAASPGFVEGTRLLAARGLVFDAVVRATQLGVVARLADAVPELVVVLDHLGKPPVGTADAPRRPDETPWLGDLRALAERPRVYAKLSGLPAEAGGTWDAAQVEPFFDAALAAFGPERLLVGGDWPVSARDDPQGWLDAVAAWAQDRLGSDGAESVLSRTAEAVYLSR